PTINAESAEIAEESLENAYSAVSACSAFDVCSASFYRRSCSWQSPNVVHTQNRSHVSGGAFSGLPMVLRYSGYMVCGPPRVAARGRPYQSVTSVRNSLVPGR